MNNNLMFRSVLGFGCIALWGLITAGCSDGKLKTYPVQGRVVFDDQSAPMFGDVEFFNENHRINARGVINRDGTFTVSTFTDNDGAVAGKHKVIITQNTASPLTARIRQEIQHDHGHLIALEYNDYRTSDLECEIFETRDNEIEFVVKKNPRQTEDGMPLESK